jgi:putative toxin-antitoxin system antitoxin component (TIGR02293 family)
MEMERNIVSALGGPKILGKHIRGATDLIDLVEKGLPWSAAFHLKESFGITDREYARMLGVSERTLTRHKAQLQKRLGLVESDRLYRMARIFALAQEVLENDRRAMAWLRRSQIGLGGRTSLDMMRTEVGAREVEDLLGRIEHSVYS